MLSLFLIIAITFVKIQLFSSEKEIAKLFISDSQVTLLSELIEFNPNSTIKKEENNFYLKHLGKICLGSSPTEILVNCIFYYQNYNRNWILLSSSFSLLKDIYNFTYFNENKTESKYSVSAVIANYDTIPELSDLNFTIYPNIIPLYQVNNSLYQTLSQQYTIDKEKDNVFVEINYITKGQLVIVNVSFYLSLNLLVLCITVSVIWTILMRCYKKYFPNNNRMTIQSLLRLFSFLKIIAAACICYYYELQYQNIIENKNSSSIEIYLNMVIVTLNSILTALFWFFLILICYGWLIYKSNFTKSEFKKLTVYFIILYIVISMDQLVDLFFKDLTISFSDWKNFFVFTILGGLCVKLCINTIAILKMKYTYAARYSRNFLPSLKLKISNIKFHLGICLTYLFLTLGVIINVILFRKVLKDLVTLMKCIVDIMAIIAMMCVYYPRKFTHYDFIYSEETVDGFLQDDELYYWNTRKVYTFKGNLSLDNNWDGTFTPENTNLTKNEIKSILKSKSYPVIVMTPFGNNILSKNTTIHIGFFRSK